MYFYIVSLRGNEKPFVVAAENKNEIASKFGSILVNCERIDTKTAKKLLSVTIQTPTNPNLYYKLPIAKVKPTNGDRIRQMTDEELSVLCNAMGHDFPPYAKCDGDDFECVREDGDCRKCCLEWLGQEESE